MSDYRVNLEVYNGPLDLLLYLIRREEVDIYDIPIARITQQYLGYVEILHAMDPNLAGDFLVMAATLMEIKTRLLLPTPPVEQGEASDLEIDPRTELVRQLLEYKAFKDAAGDLRDAAETQARRFGRRPAQPDGGQREVDLEDVQLWDLLDAFSNILEAIGADKATHQVIYDDTPIELHAEDILDRLARDGPMTFRRIFEGRTERDQLLGLFLAVLELVRLKKILVRQERNFGEINVHLNPDAPAESQEGHALTPPNLDIEPRGKEEPPMLMKDILDDRAAVAPDDETRTRRAFAVAQESDDDDLDDEDLDDDLDDEDDLDEDDDFDDDLDDDEEGDDEEWEDEPEDSTDTVVSAGQADAGQYVAEKPAKRARDDDSPAAAG
jgi:segregation and condensation protein A